MPGKKKQLRYLLLLCLLALNVGCDQVTKIMVRKNVDYHENISLIKDRLTLTKVENTGAFLSLGDDLPQVVRFGLLSLMPILVLSFGLYYLFSRPGLPLLMQLALCFLIGGGIGNIYDRLKFGSVTDFLHADLGIFSTGVFNFADVSIMTGIGMLMLSNLLERKVTATKEQG